MLLLRGFNLSCHRLFARVELLVSETKSLVSEYPLVLLCNLDKSPRALRFSMSRSFLVPTASSGSTTIGWYCFVLSAAASGSLIRHSFSFSSKEEFDIFYKLLARPTTCDWELEEEKHTKAKAAYCRQNLSRQRRWWGQPV